MFDLKKTPWHGFEAWQLENEGLRVQVVPAAGGKIVSLVDKVAGYEWLVSPELAHPFKPLEYGADFNSLNPGGWDEMFPTIVAGTYPVPGAWQGRPLPDHGELWTQPWLESAAGAGLSLTIAGKALPYRLTRTLTLTGPREMCLDYEVTNVGDQPLAYLWAAHPQFACEIGAEIELPPDVSEVVNVLPLDWGEVWGPPGTRNAWPEKRTPSGEVVPQHRVGTPSLRQGRKFYLPPDQPIAWAGVRQPKAGCRLRLDWDAKALPYCGIWIDEGYLNKIPAVAIEPTTGYYDDLTLAWKNGRVSELAPAGRRNWRLTVHCDNA